MQRDEKEKQVELLRDELTQAPALVLASHVGMPVNTVNELRSELRKVGASYRVVKNTLAKIALEGSDKEAMAELFRGPTAVAYHPEDPTAAAKVIVDFKKKNDRFEIKAGFLGGSVLDADGVETLSKMPGKDELRARLLSVLNGVGTKFVRTLAAAPQQFVSVLNARKNDLAG